MLFYSLLEIKNLNKIVYTQIFKLHISNLISEYTDLLFDKVIFATIFVCLSEIMLTSFFVIIVLFNAFFIITATDIFIVVIIIWFKSTNSLMSLASSETFLVVTHCLHLLIWEFVKDWVTISIFIIKHLFLVDFHLLVFELLNCFLDISSSLFILQIVLIKFMLKVIYVNELLDINCIKAFQLGFKVLIFFLIFRFDILDSLETFLSTF